MRANEQHLLFRTNDGARCFPNCRACAVDRGEPLDDVVRSLRGLRRLAAPGAQPAVPVVDVGRLAEAAARFSTWLDGTYFADLDPEALLWRRVTKGGEEAGEVQKALRAFVGENPRKPRGPLDDVIDELLDEAFAALGAVEHLTGQQGRSVELLIEKATSVCARVGLASGGTS